MSQTQDQKKTENSEMFNVGQDITPGSPNY